MASIQIRGVPQHVVDALRSAATQRGQSMQRYLTELLTEQARIALTTAVLDEAAANARRTGARLFDSVALVREGRDARSAELTADVPDPRRQ